MANNNNNNYLSTRLTHDDGDDNFDHYAKLGVDKTATIEDIKKAFKNLALQCHPDKSKDKDKDCGQENVNQFLTIQESYRILSDEQSRRDYDALLRDAALRQTSIVNEVITLDDMIYHEDDLTYRMLCRCGGDYVVEYPVGDLVQVISCDTCSLAVKLCGNKISSTSMKMEKQQIQSEEKSSRISSGT